MKKTLWAALLVPQLCLVSLPAQEVMSLVRFREIITAPADGILPEPNLLRTGILWTNATVAIRIEYPNRGTVKDEATETCRVVKGKYLVTTVRSHLSKEPMDSIMTFDEKSGSYRNWAVQGTNVIEGLIVYDFQRKICAMNSTYGDGFTELGVGSYTDVESVSRTLVYRKGVLFCTRLSTTRPKNTGGGP